MVGSYLQALMLAIFLSLLMFGVGWVIATFAVRMVESPGALEALRQTLTRRLKIETGLEGRRQEREAQCQELERDLATYIKNRQQLQRKLTFLKNAGDRMVRIVGEESVERQRYNAQVSNRYVSGNPKEQKHALIDNSWAQPQSVEIWATSIGEARSLLDKRYPPAFGFVIHNLTSPSSGEEAAAS